MRFDRQERYEPLNFNARRQAAFTRKQARERDRYPLFPEHVAAEQISLDEEEARRVARRCSSERTMRALQAKHWRQSRRAYFAQSPEVRARIMARWNSWTGPLNPTCFSYIVRDENGELARLSRDMHAGRAAMHAALPDQQRLEA